MTLTVDNITGISKITNNGKLVKTGTDTPWLSFDNASTGITVVCDGTLKLGSEQAGAKNDHTVLVKSGATFDLNGYKNNIMRVILEDGAYLINTRYNIPNTYQQIKSITLEGNATVSSDYNFGLRSENGENKTTLALDSNTLTFDGEATFWLAGATITGSGVVNVANGTLQCVSYSSAGADCTLNIGANGMLRIDNNLSLTVKNFHNGGTYYVYSGYGLGTLVVTGTLTTGNKVTKLTLGNGATIKMTGTDNAQTVTTTFSASGEIKVDGSEITRDALAEATGIGIPVLKVPASFDPKNVKWSVSGTDAGSRSLRWVASESGKTLWLCRASGMMLIIK